MEEPNRTGGQKLLRKPSRKNLRQSETRLMIFPYNISCPEPDLRSQSLRPRVRNGAPNQLPHRIAVPPTSDMQEQTPQNTATRKIGASQSTI